MNKVTLMQRLLLSLFFCLTSAYANTEDSAVLVKWGYLGHLGPQYWAQLSPTFGMCAKGKKQSPINIPHAVTTSSNALTLHYALAPMMIVNDGTTALLFGITQTVIEDGHGIQLNFPKRGVAESMTLNDKTYRLVQFHLHTPSENQLQGQSYPMEIHFVHQGQEGEVAVLGVFVKSGPENKALQRIIDHIPSEKGIPFPIPGERINPVDLLPVNQDYYSFIGSLTTPPCSEGVHWAVMAEAITASPAQIVALKKAADGANARPVQSLHGRSIDYATSPTLSK